VGSFFIQKVAFNTICLTSKLFFTEEHQRFEELVIMPDQRDPWTIALVIFVSVIAVKIGVCNLEWGLKTASQAFTTLEARPNK
jgi:hypothetical protein